jgi:hypothetical protein
MDDLPDNFPVRAYDLRGERFGLWTVLAFAHVKNTRAYWHCRCACGNERVMEGSYLCRELSQGCGCPETRALRETTRAQSSRARETVEAEGAVPVLEASGQDRSRKVAKFGLGGVLGLSAIGLIVALPFMLARVARS